MFFLFTPITVGIIPDAFPSPSDVTPPYALDFAGGPNRVYWNNIDKFSVLTYFLFYTFFKSGIDPDCIDLITDDKNKTFFDSTGG